MIDIEPKVYTKVRSALASFNVTMKSIEDFTPKAFPTVALYEDDNYTRRDTISSKGEEHAEVMYVVNIYTNGNSKKQNAKNIFSKVDETLMGLGFIRQVVTPVPNNNYYRLSARYIATVGNDEKIYRR